MKGWNLEWLRDNRKDRAWVGNFTAFQSRGTDAKDKCRILFLSLAILSKGDVIADSRYACPHRWAEHMNECNEILKQKITLWNESVGIYHPADVWVMSGLWCLLQILHIGSRLPFKTLCSFLLPDLFWSFWVLHIRENIDIGISMIFSGKFERHAFFSCQWIAEEN